jgi:hypothetical protein
MENLIKRLVYVSFVDKKPFLASYPVSLMFAITARFFIFVFSLYPFLPEQPIFSNYSIG